MINHSSDKPRGEDKLLADFIIGELRYSTVTTFAKFFGLSGLIPRSTDK